MGFTYKDLNIIYVEFSVFEIFYPILMSWNSFRKSERDESHKKDRALLPSKIDLFFRNLSKLLAGSRGDGNNKYLEIQANKV